MRDDASVRAGAFAAGPAGPLDLPDELPEELTAPDDGEHRAGGPSLLDELSAMVADGKTYVEAELAFQKSRAGFVAGSAKGIAVLGVGALAFVHLALIALVVGLVMTLAPLVGPLGATAIVVLALLVGAVLLALRLRRHVGAVAAAFAEPRP